MNPVIELLGVHKRFGGRPVITGLNLNVEPGEAVGLTGPSGVGKSTVLRMIAGLETPDSGHVCVNTARVGYVFQEARLLPWNTVLANVALPLIAQRMNRAQALERSRDYLRRMELEKFENASPRQLSGGMRQRVALARALAVRPEVLLLDEPFTGLDVRLKQSMQSLLETALNECKAAIVHVTHDPAELVSATDRVVNLCHADGPEPT